MFKTIIRTMTSQYAKRSFGNAAAVTNKMDLQQEAMLRENCYLVDEADNIIGEASKRDCHLVQENGYIPLHRAFSVFLFNKKGDLLLQKELLTRLHILIVILIHAVVTPLSNFEEEADENNALGVKKAAQRRLQFELGIHPDSVPLNSIQYITRILYKDEGDGKYGEHEIDYVLFIKNDVQLKPNPDEVSEISFIPRKEFDNFAQSLSGHWTPWFNLIMKSRLKYWWDNLDNLDEIRDHEKILHLK